MRKKKLKVEKILCMLCELVHISLKGKTFLASLELLDRTINSIELDIRTSVY